MQTVTINIAGADISVPAERAVHAFLREVLDDAEIAEARPAFRFDLEEVPQPKIGEPHEGGIYAGRLFDGTHLYDLIAAPRANEITEADWKHALDLAACAAVNDRTDWTVPTRAEALCLFERLQPVVKGTDEAFEDAYYWTSQPYERAAGCAWCQSFGYGLQFNFNRDILLRARFVRRKVIQ